MQLKIKDLTNMLPQFNPESVIEIGGGHIEYSTNNVEIIESNGVVTFQEASGLKKDRYTIVDVPDVRYDKLVIFKSHLASLSDVPNLFDNDYSGVVIVDSLFSAGNSSNRFIKIDMEDGKPNLKTTDVVSLKHHDPIRMFSNSCIQGDPNRLETSTLNSAQKNLLLKGVSI